MGAQELFVLLEIGGAAGRCAAPGERRREELCSHGSWTILEVAGESDCSILHSLGRGLVSCGDAAAERLGDFCSEGRDYDLA